MVKKINNTEKKGRPNILDRFDPIESSNGKQIFLFSQCESPACESLEQRRCRILKDFESLLGEYSFLKDEIIKILIIFSSIGEFPKFRILKEFRYAISHNLKKGRKKKRK